VFYSTFWSTGDQHDSIVQVFQAQAEVEADLQRIDDIQTTQSVHDLMLGLRFETPQQDVDAVQVHDPTEHAYHDAGLKSPAAGGCGRW
jgi:hypothetical protein